MNKLSADTLSLVHRRDIQHYIGVWEQEVKPMLIFYLQMLDTPEEKARFEQIYQQYRSLMYHVANNILHDSQDAEDTVHNAFLRIIIHFSKLQCASAQDLAPLLVVITKNEAISVLRKRKDVVPLDDWDGFAETSENIASYHALVESFTCLPGTYRAIMEMKLLSGYSDGEIAAKEPFANNLYELAK